MSERAKRSAWEEARIDLRSATAGQRYTAGIALLLAVVVLSTGMPDGVVQDTRIVGAIPDLATEAGPESVVPSEDETEPAFVPQVTPTTSPATTTTTIAAMSISSTTSTTTSPPTTTTTTTTTTTATTTTTTTTTPLPLLPLP